MELNAEYWEFYIKVANFTETRPKLSLEVLFHFKTNLHQNTTGK